MLPSSRKVRLSAPSVDALRTLKNRHNSFFRRTLDFNLLRTHSSVVSKYGNYRHFGVVDGNYEIYQKKTKCHRSWIEITIESI